MSKIVAIGDEDFTLGFELVGLETFPVKKFEEILTNKFDVGIVIISQESYDLLSSKVKLQIDRSLKPVVVILSEKDIKGGNLREAIIKALGVDLLNK